MTQFWKNEVGTYYYQTSAGSYQELPSGIEGEQLMARIDLAKAIAQSIKSLAPIMETAEDTVKEYWDEVNANGAFTDEDLASTGMTATQLTADITLLDQMPKLFEGMADENGKSTIIPTVFRITVNAVKRLPL